MPITFESYCGEKPEVFNCDHLIVPSGQSAMGVLNEYGVAIIPAVLSSEECEESLQFVHQFYENLTKNMDTPYNHNDPRTYRTLAELHQLHSMLYQGYGIGQCQGSWNVRQHPKIYEAFTRIWNDDDLLTSMDGLAYQIAPEVMTGPRSDVGFHKHTWYHTDQSYTRNDLECIQGQVPLFDVAPGDATLMVLEGSHRYHKAFAERFGARSLGDWCLLEQQGKERGEGHKQFYFDMGCTERRISCPSGSLVLWDSRTIHCGGEPIQGRPNPDHWRSVVYVCMTPRNLCDKANMDLRKKAFRDLETTSHWPHRLNIFKTLATGKFVTHPADVHFADQQHPSLTELGQRLLLGADNAEEVANLREQGSLRVVQRIKADERPESAKGHAVTTVAATTAESEQDLKNKKPKRDERKDKSFSKKHKK